MFSPECLMSLPVLVLELIKLYTLRGKKVVLTYRVNKQLNQDSKSRLLPNCHVYVLIFTCPWLHHQMGTWKYYEIKVKVEVTHRIIDSRDWNCL